MAPGNTGSTTLNLDMSVPQRSIAVNTAANVAGLYFYNPSGGYGYSIYNSSGSLTIGAGGISFQSGVDAYFDFFVPLVLSHDAAISGGSTYYTAIYSGISETGGSRNLTTNGRVYLFGTDTYSGGLTVATGTVYLGTNTAAGTGQMIADNNVSLDSVYNPVTLSNAVSLGNYVTLSNNGFGNDQSLLPQLTFSGTVTLQNSGTTVYLNSYTSVALAGTLTGPPGTAVSVSGQGTKLPFDGGSQLVIEGATSNVASISVLNASLILAPSGTPGSSFSSIGATGLSIGNSDQPGYLGLDGTFSSATGSVVNFLTTYGPTLGANIGGTLGFDTFANPSSPNTFNDPIDLSAFSSPYFKGLGSESAAILGTGAVITPYNHQYEFGGGGGTLTVESNLSDAAATLTMNQTSEPLTLVLQGTNSYTGGTTVNYGALIFDSALPASGSITVEPGAYVGYTEDASNIATAAAFISRLTVPGAGAIIGFDSASVASPRTITDPIDVSGFGSELNPFIGTATKVTLAGLITPANNEYQFTGIKGGTLTIASNLVGSGVGATFGLPSPLETNGSTSIINITGSGNTYTGGTTFNSGTLFILSGSSLGTGPIAIPDPGSVTITPYLAPYGGSLTLPNAISVGNLGGNPGVSLGDAFATDNTHPLILSGIISDGSGPGTIGIVGPVTLSGVNTYSGGTVITSSNNGYTQINVTNSSSLGGGPLTVNTYGAALVASGGNVTLPNDIYDYNGLNLGISGNPNRLILNGVISGGGSLDIESNVGLGGLNTYSGGTVVNNANVLISSTSPFGTGTLELNNSTLSYGTASQTFEDLTGDPNGVISMGTGSAVTLDTDAYSPSYTYNGAINGDGTVTLTKTGSGVEFLTGTSSYGGGTTVNGGTLVAGSNQALGSGPVTVATGSALAVGLGATVSNTLNLNSGSTLAGNGTFTAAAGVSFSAGTTVAPGDIPNQMVGSLLFSNAVTLGSGGVYILNVTDAGGLAGVGYSSVTVAGALTVTATPGSPFAVNLVSLNPEGSAGPATFSAASTYSWTLLSAGSIVGFAPADFSLNTSAFQNSTAGGVFSFSENGNAIDLNFTPVPEPSTWLLLTAGLGVLLFVGNRKRLIDRSLGKT